MCLQPCISVGVKPRPKTHKASRDWQKDQVQYILALQVCCWTLAEAGSLQWSMRGYCHNRALHGFIVFYFIASGLSIADPDQV
eukprot:7051279-Karenia_brevis.AAC.1